MNSEQLIDALTMGERLILTFTDGGRDWALEPSRRVIRESVVRECLAMDAIAPAGDHLPIGEMSSQTWGPAQSASA